MTEAEAIKKVFEKKLLEVIVVVDLDNDYNNILNTIAQAVFNADPNFFRKRFEHWLGGGLITQPERSEYARLIQEVQNASVEVQ